MKPSSSGVRWFSTAEAATHLGFVKPDGTPKLQSFYMFLQVERQRKPRRLTVHWLHGRMRFRQVDLDACLEPEPETAAAAPLRVMRGGR